MSSSKKVDRDRFEIEITMLETGKKLATGWRDLEIESLKKRIRKIDESKDEPDGKLTRDEWCCYHQFICQKLITIRNAEMVLLKDDLSKLIKYQGMLDYRREVLKNEKPESKELNLGFGEGFDCENIKKENTGSMIKRDEDFHLHSLMQYLQIIKDCDNEISDARTRISRMLDCQEAVEAEKEKINEYWRGIARSHYKKMKASRSITEAERNEILLSNYPSYAADIIAENKERINNA